ncbi:MAG: hypothetical protein LBH73_00330 [Spirochaetaceae bacterium]|jgi:hypothetical protein|nr:hypothetical protein [Spirochaetaceae bacterium]
MMYPNLEKYGLTGQFEIEANSYEGLFLARVSEQHRELYKLIAEQGELFSDNLKLSENSDFKCLSGKELTNSTPDKLKSMEYKRRCFREICPVYRRPFRIPGGRGFCDDRPAGRKR